MIRRVGGAQRLLRASLGTRRSPTRSSPSSSSNWADLRYDAPLSGDAIVEPYQPHEGTGPLPSKEDAPKLTGQDVLAAVYEGINPIEEATWVSLADDLILEHRFDDLWHHHVEREFARQVRARLSDRIRHLRGHRILLVAHSMGSAIVMTCCVS